MMNTITAIIDGEMWYAYTEPELAGLLRAVLDQPHAGWAGSLAAWGDQPGSEDHRLRVSTDLETGWGAINFLQHSPATSSWNSWETFNSTVPADAPELPFGKGAFTFPRNASLPLDKVREAVEEYCRNCRLPTCVKWQEANCL